MSKEVIRCHQCKHFKAIGHGYSGWCQDAKPKIRVQAVDFCDSAEKKEAKEDIPREAYGMKGIHVAEDADGIVETPPEEAE